MQQESPVSLLPHSLPGRFFVPPKNLSCIISLPSHGEQLDCKPNPGWEGVSLALVASPLEAGSQQQGEDREVATVEASHIISTYYWYQWWRMWSSNKVHVFSQFRKFITFCPGLNNTKFYYLSNLICITLKITWAKIPLTEEYNIDGDSGKAITLLESVQAGCSPFGLWACKTKPGIYFLSRQLHFAWS